MSLSLTDHGGVEEGGDVEDLVESQCLVDAFVLLAGAKKEHKDTQTCTQTEATLCSVLKQNDLLPPSDTDWKYKRRRRVWFVRSD